MVIKEDTLLIKKEKDYSFSLFTTTLFSTLAATTLSILTSALLLFIILDNFLAIASLVNGLAK